MTELRTPIGLEQVPFAQAEYDAKRKTTGRDRFLSEMEIIAPWARLLEVLKPHYCPNPGQRAGRPPRGLKRMLPLYLLQQWFGLPDEALEDTVYHSQAFRRFLGLDLNLGNEAVQDATIIAAPASTKNQDQVRDPKMGHQCKGNNIIKDRFHHSKLR